MSTPRTSPYNFSGDLKRKIAAMANSVTVKHHPPSLDDPHLDDILYSYASETNAGMSQRELVAEMLKKWIVNKVWK